MSSPHQLRVACFRHSHTDISASQLTFPGRANHWSAIIGGSHSKNYVLWEYGGYASEGVKQVAELGSPVKMEEEIRQQVRTESQTNQNPGMQESIP